MKKLLTHQRIPWAVFGLAAAIRLVFNLWIHPPAAFVTSDMWVYDLRAKHLLTGELGIWDTFTPVGYPAFLAVLYAVQGKTLVAIVQALLGAGTAALTHPLALRISRNPAVALVASLAVALHVPLVLYGGLLLSETPFTFLVVLGALLLLRAGETPTVPRALAAGLALGAATVIRPNLLLFLPLVGVWAVVALGHLRAAARLTALVLAGALPLLAAASIHNSRLTGRPTGLGTNGGLNFYLAHAAVKGIEYKEGSFTHRIFPIPNMIRHSRVETSAAPLYDEAHFYGKAFALLASDPSRLLGSLANVREGLNLGRQDFWPGWRGHERLLIRSGQVLFAAAILPALLYLLVLAWRGRLTVKDESGRLLLGLFVVSALVTLWLFLGDPRMRVPFDPLLIVLAADGAARAWAWRASRAMMPLPN